MTWGILASSLAKRFPKLGSTYFWLIKPPTNFVLRIHSCLRYERSKKNKECIWIHFFTFYCIYHFHYIIFPATALFRILYACGKIRLFDPLKVQRVKIRYWTLHRITKVVYYEILLVFGIITKVWENIIYFIWQNIEPYLDKILKTSKTIRITLR